MRKAPRGRSGTWLRAANDRAALASFTDEQHQPELYGQSKLISASKGVSLTTRTRLGGDIGMITKTERWSTPASGSSDGSSRPLREAAADAAKSSCMIRRSSRAWLVGLGLAVGITWAAGGSASAGEQVSPGEQASPVPTCGSPESLSSPLARLCAF